MRQQMIMEGGAAGETLDLLGGLARRPSADSTYTYSSDQSPILAPEGQQKLTIFYSGIVNVYENVPAHKAHAIMLLLAYGDSGDQKCSRPCVTTDTPEPINYSGRVVNSRLTSLRPTSSITSSSPAAAQKKQLQCRRLVTCKRSHAELPFARKASLARFLERRNRMSH